MKRTALKKISEHQVERLKLWDKITRKRIAYLKAKYGKPTCEWCGTIGYEYDNESSFYLRGHHMDGDRRNNTSGNCYVCHNKCHPPKHIMVKQEDFQGRVKWQKQRLENCGARYVVDSSLVK